MDDNSVNPKQALIEALRQAKSILVTVSSNPSVDQLAACLGLTLWLNKADKHATAVFSGGVPSTLEFLQPDETLEKNTDSLRDFIISLDKSKADKLRYKVEDSVVKIFITPYRTSLSADDLEYSQGDFNVDMVVALGVNNQEDLDNAVTAHGRILHDAKVVTITTGETASELGSISWHEPHASSLCELVTDLGNEVAKDGLDNQIATALLTGVVAETERFSNEKTSPQTMSLSAQLMSAGANQQLVASKLDHPEPEAPVEPAAGEAEADQSNENNDGAIEIEHEGKDGEEFSLPEPAEPEPESELEPAEPKLEDQPAPEPEAESSSEPEPAIEDVKQTAPDDDIQHRVTEPPQLGGTLTANAEPDGIMAEPTTDALSQASEAPAAEPLLSHGQPGQSTQPESPDPTMQPAPPSWMPPQPWMDPAAPAADAGAPAEDKTLTEIEKEVDSPHLGADSNNSTAPPDVDSARDDVTKAIETATNLPPEPSQALNAQSIDLEPAPAPATEFDPTKFEVASEPTPVPTPPAPADPNAVQPELTGPVEQPFTMPLPDAFASPAPNSVPPTSVVDDPTAPPPVPPPLPFTGPNPGNNQPPQS